MKEYYVHDFNVRVRCPSCRHRTVIHFRKGSRDVLCVNSECDWDGVLKDVIA